MVTQQRIQEWISHPAMLDKDSLFELRELLARYPYFQTARLLYLKNLFLLQDTSFAEELRKSALFVADLSVLFYYIEGERFVLKKHDTHDSADDKKSSDRTLDLIDKFLSDLSGDDVNSDMELELPTEAAVDYTSVLEEQDAEGQNDIPLKGHELIDSFIEKSASESGVELKADSDISQEDSPEEADSLPSAVEEKEENTEDESYFTETLAKIYVRQHRYEKALEIIQKLNLKYPKKNIYFADQIRFLEKLIINDKSK